MDNLFEYSDNLNEPFQAFSGNWSTVNPHWHYFTEMIYLQKGRLAVEVENREYLMSPGDLVIFHPKQIHSIYYFENDYSLKNGNFRSCNKTTADDLLFYVLKFDDMVLSNTTPGSPKLPRLLDNSTQIKNPMNLITKEQLQYIPTQKHFENCIWEIQHKQFGYDIKIASNISLIITELIRIWLTKGLILSSSKSYSYFSNTDFSVLEYIDKHSSESINIKILAKKCGMCYSNFAKQFKAQFGKTCKEYIEFIRICKADTLLLYTDKTLDYISQETGFTDASHFIRTYKKIRNMTPKQRRSN